MNREQIAALLVLAPLVLGGALIGWYGRVAVPGYGEPGTVVFNLTGVAADGVWTLAEVNGLNYWWRGFEPATLFLREGDEVVLNLRSADLLHGFYIPAFGVGPIDVKPGHMATVRFTASRAGVFQYYCTSMCGTCHFYMRGWVVVTAAGEEPARPPPILCRLCRLDLPPPPADGDLVARGAYLYLEKGCSTCHGPDGHGGVDNPNSNNSPVPRHDTTAEKLFLASEEDVDAFIELVSLTPDLDAVDDPPEISRLPIVRTRFENAKEIIRSGRYSAKIDPAGPEPPLQMPAWKFLIDEREIDALLVFFLTLEPGESGDAEAAG